MKHQNLIISGITAGLLAACGGGGGAGIGTGPSPVSPPPVASVPANTAPVAAAGNGQSVMAETVVSLDGGASKDADGDPLSYAWSVQSKPAGSGASMADPTIASARFTPDLPGDYVVALVVNDGKVGSSPSTVTISAKSPVVSVSAGLNHTVAMQKDGTLLAWGENLFGQIGDGTTANRLAPVKVGSGFSMASAGAGNAAAIKADGSLWTWGRNDYGQLGNASAISSASPIQVGSNYRSVSAGYFYVMATKNDASYWGWGDNNAGQVGDGSTDLRRAPVIATMAAGFTEVFVGLNTTFALKADGTLWGWGLNWNGEIGDGTKVPRKDPVLIGNGFVKVVAGDGSTFGLKNDGSLWAWGNNIEGQLGDGTTTSRWTPVLIGSGFATVSSGGYGGDMQRTTDVFGTVKETVLHGSAHTLAVKTDGTLWAWGDNTFGQLGDGTHTQRLVPTKIGAGFALVAAGGYATNGHSIAAKKDGSLWGWGGNGKGQVGDGSTTERLIPQPLALP